MLPKVKYQNEKNKIVKLIDTLVGILLEFSSTYDNIGRFFLLDVLFNLLFFDSPRPCFCCDFIASFIKSFFPQCRI